VARAADECVVASPMWAPSSDAVLHVREGELGAGALPVSSTAGPRTWRLLFRTGSEKDSRNRSSRATGCSHVASSYVSAASSASTWIDGGAARRRRLPGKDCASKQTWRPAGSAGAWVQAFPPQGGSQQAQSLAGRREGRRSRLAGAQRRPSRAGTGSDAARRSRGGTASRGGEWCGGVLSGEPFPMGQPRLGRLLVGDGSAAAPRKGFPGLRRWGDASGGVLSAALSGSLRRERRSAVAADASPGSLYASQWLHTSPTIRPGWNSGRSSSAAAPGTACIISGVRFLAAAGQVIMVREHTSGCGWVNPRQQRPILRWHSASRRYWVVCWLFCQGVRSAAR